MHWTNPNIRLATRVFLIPIFKYSLFALVAPIGLAYASEAVRTFMGAEQSGDDRIASCLATYPIFMCFALVVAGAFLARRAVDKWRDSVRDEIYLVGEVLHNLEEEAR